MCGINYILLNPWNHIVFNCLSVFVNVFMGKCMYFTQVIQCVCMLLHRMSTFLQICSITEVKLRRPKQLEPHEQEISVEKGLQLVRDMQVRNKDTAFILNLRTVNNKLNTVTWFKVPNNKFKNLVPIYLKHVSSICMHAPVSSIF